MLHHELLKLATLRWLRVASIVMIVVSTGFALVVCQALSSVAEALADPLADPLSAIAPSPLGSNPVLPGEVAHVVLRTSVVASVFGALVGVLSVCSDIRNGVMRLTLVHFPDRRRVLLAKATATAGVAAALAGLAALLALTVVSVVAGPLEPRAWTAGVVAHMVVAALWALAGMAAGVVLRTVAAGMAAVLAVPFIVEPAVVGVLGSSGGADLLPFRAGGQVYAAMGDSSAFTAGLGGGVIGALPLVAVVAFGFVVAGHRFGRLCV